jgi:hypothetical protein
VLTLLRRPVSILAALAVIAPVTLAAANVQAATGRQAVPAASQAPQLARAVAHARTPAARVTAIDHMMAVLHVDVINPASGAVVVPGAARSLNDAYLYTSEVQRLAAAYAQGDRVTLAALARELGLVYAKLGVRLTASSLGAGLVQVIKADARSSAPDSVALLSRLIWQLGLLHQSAQNLAGNIKVAGIRLDPLQAWLIIAEFTYPLIYGNPPPGQPASQLAALSDGVVTHSAPASPAICDTLKPIHEALGFSDKMVLHTVEDILGKAFKWAAVLQLAGKILGPLIDIAHGAVTGIGIQIHSAINPASTSLGGRPMHLSVGVFMSLHLPKVLVDCGWLSGDDFPGHGPVPGVFVVWDNSELSPWGTITCHGCSKTAADGTANETFTPGPEEVHKGVTVIEPGTVKAYTFVNTSMGNKLGFLGDVVRDEGAMVWELSHHKTGYPTGFSAQVHAVQNPYYDSKLTITGTRKKGDPINCNRSYYCYYQITHISGEVTVTFPNQPPPCTVAVPPYNNLNPVVGLDGGRPIRFWFNMSFTTAPLPLPCGYVGTVNVEEAATKISDLPEYKFGETDSHVALIDGGTAVITWQY